MAETHGKCPRCGSRTGRLSGGVLCPVCLLDACLAAAPTPGGEGAAIRDGETAPAVPEHLRRFGDYELIEELGRGAMGVVYRARQLSLGREVAVKFLLAGPLASAEMIERFHREAAAAGALQYPNIVAVREAGVHGGQHYLVMDYIAERSLEEVVAEPGARGPDFERRSRWVWTIARAVHHAHEHGILHRDLKPSNVLIDAEDQPRVMDFGLARSLVTDSRLTLSDQVLGSPCYLPPEQAGGKQTPVSRASDVYALGATLYHLLTGRPPFLGESPAEVIRAVLESEPVRPRLVNPRVPRDLEIICLKCLEKESKHRYPTAWELADDLEWPLNREPIRARPVGPIGRAWRWGRRKLGEAGLAGALLMAVALGLAGVLWQWNRARATAVRESHKRERAERTVYNLQIHTAEEHFTQNQAAEGLAILAGLLRKEPADRAVAERLMAELTFRNWPLPLLDPLAHPETGALRRIQSGTGGGASSRRPWTTRPGCGTRPPDGRWAARSSMTTGRPFIANSSSAVKNAWRRTSVRMADAWPPLRWTTRPEYRTGTMASRCFRHCGIRIGWWTSSSARTVRPWPRRAGTAAFGAGASPQVR